MPPDAVQPNDQSSDQTFLAPVGSSSAPGPKKPIDNILDNLGISIPQIPEAAPAEAISALKDVVTAQKRQLEVTTQSTERNIALMNLHNDDQSLLDNDTLDAMNKLQKIDRWGGVGSGVIKMLGLFDSDWNPEVQKNRITQNDVKSQQVANRVKTAIEINNLAPQIAGAATAQAQDIFNMQSKIIDIAQKAKQMGIDDAKTRVEAVDAYSKLSEDDRKTVDRMLVSMDEGQVKGEIKKVEAGKASFWGDKLGLLKNRLMDEQKAKVSLEKAQQEAAAGNIDLANKHYEDLAYHMGPELGPLIDAALNAHQPMVVLGAGTKNEVAIPVANAIAGMNRREKETKDYRTAIADHDRQAVGNAFDQTMRSAVALAASGDKDAVAEVGLLSTLRERTDLNNPQSIAQMKAMVDASSSRIQKTAKAYADQYKSPEARAGVNRFFTQGGQFDDIGGQAVLKDVIGNAFAGSRTKYSDAFSAYNTALATRISQLNIAGMTALNPSNPVSVAQILAKAPLIKDVDKIKDDILNDTTIQSQVSDIIQSHIKKDALMGTLQGLSKVENKDVSALWTRLSDMVKSGDRSLSDDAGNLDYSKIAWFLEQRSVEGGMKVDYGKAFTDAIQAYALANKDGNANDPQMTIADRAMEAAMFGGSPYMSGMGALAQNLKDHMAARHTEMQQRIQEDLRGQTARKFQALQPAPAPGMENQVPPALPSMIPSATGVGTVADIQAKFGGMR